MTFTDRMVFHDGDREIQVIHLGRYHTDGDAVFYFPKGDSLKPADSVVEEIGEVAVNSAPEVRIGDVCNGLAEVPEHIPEQIAELGAGGTAVGYLADHVAQPRSVP